MTRLGVLAVFAVTAAALGFVLLLLAGLLDAALGDGVGGW